ncbi:MAG: autotransporter-associated beta strand repeat-containing protein [Pirellulales bacterium]|nr:autotransporter-associated beta strand repeat-containing protein [Pirellulales bacterium]
MNMRFWLPLALLASLLTFTTTARAVVTWDAVQYDYFITDGNGTWDDGFNYTWTTDEGISNITWNNASPDVAQFGHANSTLSGTPFVVTVDIGGVTATGIDFQEWYNLEGTGTITLSGTSPVISATPPIGDPRILARINTAIASSAATIQFDGYAIGTGNNSDIRLGGTNTFTSTMELTGGGFVGIETVDAYSTASSGTIVNDNCTLLISAGGSYGSQGAPLGDLHLSGFGAGGFTATNPSDSRGAIRFSHANETSVDWYGDVVLDADAAICNNQGGVADSATFYGVISGDHMWMKTGLGHVRLANANTYTGETQIYRGILRLGSTSGYAFQGDLRYVSYGTKYTRYLYLEHGDEESMPQMAPTAVIHFDPDLGSQYVRLRGHTLTIAGLDDGSPTVNNMSAVENFDEDAGTSTGHLIIGSADNYTYRGIIRDNSGFLAVTKRGAGTQTLDGQAHRFSGGLTIEEGTIIYGSNTEHTSHYSSSLVVKTGATLDISAVTGFAISNAYTYESAQQVLSGGGTVIGNVAVATGGSISPGESAGVLTFDNSLDFSGGGDLAWGLEALADDVTGTPGVDFDLLFVAGNLTLGGDSQLTLDFTTVGAPDEGTAFWNANHSWKIIDVDMASVTTDNFTTLINEAFDAGTFTTTVDTAGDVFLEYTAGSVVYPPGDATKDGVVDALDAQRLAANWLKNSGVGWDEGDFNADGVVNDLDASIMAANWGYGAEAVGVPEPSILVSLLGALAAIVLLGRRKR